MKIEIPFLLEIKQDEGKMSCPRKDFRRDLVKANDPNLIIEDEVLT
jgi:hypothetical protein